MAHFISTVSSDDLSESTQVWDPLLRLFHWSLAIGFSLSYLTGDDFEAAHEQLGYFLLGLLAFRLVWGLIGPKHARFSDFVRSPSTVLAYLHQILQRTAPRHLGHNPAGGAMALALMGMVLLCGLSGLALLGADEASGPLAFLFYSLNSDTAELLEEVHEFFTSGTLLLIGLHLGGVLLASVQHDENLVGAMLHGRKRIH